MNTCQHCGQGLIPCHRWRKMTAAAKEEARRNNMARKGKEGICHRCDRRNNTGLSRAERDDLNAQATRARIEDLEWMADTGESWGGAVTRLGLSSVALERFLQRHERVDLMARLCGREMVA